MHYRTHETTITESQWSALLSRGLGTLLNDHRYIVLPRVTANEMIYQPVVTCPDAPLLPDSRRPRSFEGERAADGPR